MLIIPPQPSMSLPLIGTYDNLRQEIPPYKQPSREIRDWVRPGREGPGRIARWLETTGSGIESSNPQAQCSRTPPQQQDRPQDRTDAAPSYSMLAPTYGGLYRSSIDASKGVTREATGNPSLPPSPTKTQARDEGNEVETENSDGASQIAGYLQIPSSINSSKGSLAEFAAQVREIYKVVGALD